jgi:nickel transport protein
MRLLALSIMLLFGSNLFAHQLLLETKIEATQVRVEAFFDDDSPADEATVQVTNESAEVIAQGKTDANGVWYFPRPKGGSYTLKVSSLGHVGEKTLDAPLTRDEQTRTPWAKIGIGLGLIFLCTLGWLFSRRRATPAA